jgi:hypothetical protein
LGAGTGGGGAEVWCFPGGEAWWQEQTKSLSEGALTTLECVDVISKGTSSQWTLEIWRSGDRASEVPLACHVTSWQLGYSFSFFGSSMFCKLNALHLEPRTTLYWGGWVGGNPCCAHCHPASRTLTLSLIYLSPRQGLICKFFFLLPKSLKFPRLSLSSTKNQYHFVSQGQREEELSRTWG